MGTAYQRLKRMGDMLDVAAQVTQIDQLRLNWLQLQSDIQQELASEGLKHYRSILDQFIVPANEIQSELEILVQLAQTKSDAHGTENSRAKYVEADNTQLFHNDLPIELDWVRRPVEFLDLNQMIEELGKRPNAFRDELIRLYQRHEIVILRKPNP